MKYTDWLIPRLRNLEQVRYSIPNMETKLQTLKLQYSAIRAASTDATPVMGGVSGREDALIANIAERQELEKNLQFARAEVKELEEALEHLQPDERTVLVGFYVRRRRNAADWLAGEMNCDRATVYRIRERGLIAMARILYGRVEL